MNNQKLLKSIEEVLKTDERLWFLDEKTKKQEFDIRTCIGKLESYDEEIIHALFQNQTIKEKFFIKTGNSWIFKCNHFQFFLEEHKIDNSYTEFKNRIGLSDGRRFLKDNKEIVLNFPFKDCVLEGGQSTEEGKDTYFKKDKQNKYQKTKAKRKEIFYNEILAHDEIDRLLDEKAFVNFKRFNNDNVGNTGLVGNTGPCSLPKTEIKRNANGTIQENLIIKGNNLIALHSLKKQFAKKIKLIYIDPPYNTGNDGFKYNDNFNHSTWLTFMKNRLEIARELLREDGVMFVQCDDNEQAYLKVLMDEVFGRGNFVNNFTWINNLKGRQISNYGAAKTHEFILCYAKKSNNLEVFKMPIDRLKKMMPSIYKGFEYETKKDLIGEYVIKNELHNTNSLFNEATRPNLVFNIHYNFRTKQVKFSDVGKEVVYDGYTKINPKENNDGIHKYQAWRWSKTKIKKELYNLEFIKIEGAMPKIYTKIRDFKTTTVKDILSDIKVNGNGELKKLMKYGIFSYPKPEDLIYILIEMSTQKNDIILDYHLGSGTTAAVAHKMGRQYIGIEQMDYVENIAVERLKKIIAGEQGGISKAVKWQGGGSFIYCELAQWNEKAKEQILHCENLEALKTFFEEMVEKYFLNYNLKIKEFQEEVLEEEDFKNLPLEKQKEMFCKMLDNNMIYVCRSEMEDAKFGISENDIEMTNNFYGKEN